MKRKEARGGAPGGGTVSPGPSGKRSIFDHFAPFVKESAEGTYAGANIKVGPLCAALGVGLSPRAEATIKLGLETLGTVLDIIESGKQQGSNGDGSR